MCVRYLTDYLQTQYPTIFTLSPRSDSSLTLKGDKTGVFQLSWDRFGSNSLWFSPSIRFWPNVGADIWNRVCVTVDTRVNEAQVFSGSNMSIRKMLPAQVRMFTIRSVFIVTVAFSHTMIENKM